MHVSHVGGALPNLVQVPTSGDNPRSLPVVPLEYIQQQQFDVGHSAHGSFSSSSRTLAASPRSNAAANSGSSANGSVNSGSIRR
ncbi:hypothetical protein PV318_07780 [Streptomyces sp. ME02-6991-2B]|nr:hypothetical protein [Streptomyces sp. ME02-6991-2B]